MRFTPLRAIFAFPLLSATALAQAPLHLIPQPRQVTPHGDHPITAVDIRCSNCDAEDQFAAQDLRDTLAQRGIPVGQGGFPITLERRANDPALTPEMRAEGYAITATPQGLILTGATGAGLFYAAQTAKQLIDTDLQHHPIAHLADIRDYPVLRYRGLHDDLSRGPVDTFEYQKKLIRTLAAYKDNVYSPYFEHTQQYVSNPLPAPPGGAVTPEEARELTAYARQYHITVIPEQEAFGHLHHNLTWEQYSQLAETPHGTVLAPAQPGSLQLIDQMFTELAADYPGPFLHIGADETVDLGHGQTKAAVDQQGLGPVYLNYLQQIDKTLKPLNRRLLWWGDIAQGSPDLVKALPADFKHDTIAVPWWYNPSKTGYAKYIRPFTDAGMETWIAPGINNWSRVYPDWNDAISNIQGFTREGVQLGAVGQLNTLWNDDGETLAANDAFGILFGAAQAWQGGQGSATDFEAAFAPVFHGDATGKLNQAQAEIMAAHALLRNEAHVGDASDGLFWMDPWSKDGQAYATKIRPYTHELRLHAERALTLIAQARAAYPASQTSLANTSSRPQARSAEVERSAAYPATNVPPGTNTTENRQPATDNFAPTTLREPDTIDALELGARRIDFIGLKFQLCDEIPALYARTQADAASPDKKTRAEVAWDLSYIRGVNGRLEDIVARYSQLRDMHADLWLRTNRPYALRPVLEHYDYTIGLWYTRIDRFRSAERQWGEDKTLPTPTDLGLPPIPPPTTAH